MKWLFVILMVVILIVGLATFAEPVWAHRHGHFGIGIIPYWPPYPYYYGPRYYYPPYDYGYGYPPSAFCPSTVWVPGHWIRHWTPFGWRHVWVPGHWRY